jgi:surface protein
MYTLSFLDVKTLLQAETVSKTWRALCKNTIRNKYCGSSKAFQSNEELKDAVKKYCRYKRRPICKYRQAMEEIACTSGYPMDTWDVSQITDMSSLFEYQYKFNEYIGSWDVSNVTDISYMFRGASDFNQEIGHWDTANVTNMHHMFQFAFDFNQEVGSWDTSNVKDISHMIHEATTFNQEIKNWDTSNVIAMSGMFHDAKNFDQKIKSWNNYQQNV